jgi:integrase
VADITEQDIEQTLARAQRKAEQKRGKAWRAATRFQLYQSLRRLFDLAIKPGRLRADNPVSVDLKPRKDKSKLFSFLYPSELLAVLKCPDVPLVRRVHYALAVYTGLRKGSLRALRWGDMDFRNRTLTVFQTKKDLPLMFEVSADLVSLLQAWHEHLGQPKPAHHRGSRVRAKPRSRHATRRLAGGRRRPSDSAQNRPQR